MKVWSCRKIWCPKGWDQLVGKFNVYIPSNNLMNRYLMQITLYFFLLFWDIVKALLTCNVESFGNALRSQKR